MEDRGKISENVVFGIVSQLCTVILAVDCLVRLLCTVVHIYRLSFVASYGQFLCVFSLSCQ